MGNNFTLICENKQVGFKRPVNYGQLDRECTLLEAMINPLAISYKVYGNTKTELLEKLTKLCLRKNIDVPKRIPGNKECYYCGIMKRNGAKIYNRVYFRYHEKKRQNMATIWWTPFVTKKDTDVENCIDINIDECVVYQYIDVGDLL